MSNFLRYAHKSISIFIVLMMVISGIGASTASAKIEEASFTPSTQNRTIEAAAAPLGINLLRDPSFEGSYNSSTGPWFQNPFDTICWSGTGICDINGAGYHSGGAWAGFGPQSSSYGEVYQDVIFPRCGAQLEFYLYLGQYLTGYGANNFFIAYIDNTEVFRVYGSQISSYSIYTKVSIPVNQFADGAKHRVRFYGELVENFLFFNLDDVALYGTIPPSSGCAGINVKAANTGLGTYGVPSRGAERLSFPVESGPVQVTSTNAVPIIASERVIFPKGSNNPSHFSEMMGLPFHLRSTRYVFPAYDNSAFDSQLRFANVGNASTTVTVTIKGTLRSTDVLAPNQSLKRSYVESNGDRLSAGPVVVQSTGGVPIVASLRVATRPYNGSLSEIMGLPQKLAGTGFVFPWYNNIPPLNTQIRIGNVGTATTTVTVTIAGVPRGSFTLDPATSPSNNPSTRVSFAGVSGGPVVVSSTGNVPIVASMRVAFQKGATWTGFSEMMGLPLTQAHTTYHFPWYNNTALDTQLRVANLSGSPASIRVYLGGQELAGSPFTLPGGASTRKSFAGANGGPVRVVSNQLIVASLRLIIPKGSSSPTYFSELMGLPQTQLSTSYYFPWYNNIGLDTQLRFGVP